MFSDRIKLLRVVKVKNDEGRYINQSSETEVWANRKSVTRNEFYASNQAGISTTAVFEVHSEDYNGETEIIADKPYIVTRTYQKSGTIELNCRDK